MHPTRIDGHQHSLQNRRARRIEPLRQDRCQLLIVGGSARQPKTAVLIARHDCAFQEEKWTETLPRDKSRQCWWAAYGALCKMRTSIDSVTATPTVSPVSSLMREIGMVTVIWREATLHLSADSDDPHCRGHGKDRFQAGQTPTVPVCACR